MNVLSLFDGISSRKVALERAGIPITKYYASEIDKYAMAVSRARHKDIIQLGYVKNWRAKLLQTHKGTKCLVMAGLWT